MQYYSNYGYYPPHPYPQTPHHPATALHPPVNNAYPSYYHQSSSRPGYVPPEHYHNPSAYPQPVQNGHSMDRPKSHRRNNTVPTAPLKSAMRPTVPQDTDDYPNLTRQRTNSTGHNVLVRTRTKSNPEAPDVPFHVGTSLVHIFVSFRNSNEILFENITQPALNELRPKLLLKDIWPPGVEYDQQIGYNWVVKYRDAPWEMKKHTNKACGIILYLFSLFALRGFSFRTATNLKDTFPRLVFQATSPDSESVFFLGYFSKGGRRFTMINPPPEVDLAVGAELKRVFVHQIARMDIEEENNRVIELKAKSNRWAPLPQLSTPVEEPSFFMMHVYKILVKLGFILEAAVPLASNGLFSFASHQELLVFRGRLRA
ncbi:hypothetical protein AMATHDRAFT_42 [Amanita thiersii Skay4041]|uniref:Uncharacterized protein n=1 Tax=Amanita thiersii Skay4041 TaxID=703135 RepID=A0A2A9P1I0_9AGAR|nr:hypothetical protein AMATHDRAFT_42 [Amanita thiersii Skay4041]